MNLNSTHIFALLKKEDNHKRCIFCEADDPNALINNGIISRLNVNDKSYWHCNVRETLQSSISVSPPID